MELSVRAICRPALSGAFLLAGVPVDEAADAVACAECLKRRAQDPRVGVLLVEASLHQALSSELKQRLDRQAVPMVVPFPDPSWDGRALAEEYVLEILRQAIGYRVRP
jgi:vacuolar-type H+-ATPase subunit F/Vma7